jgi:CRISPR system Cascade subunit CasE
VSEDRAGPVLARARLRRDRPAQALARVLVPDEPGAQSGAAHALVWSLFADDRDRRRDFLWRQTRPGEFLILAARSPADPHGLFDLDYKPFAPALHSGQRLRFDLRANPVVSVPKERGRRGKRKDVITHALSQIDPGKRAAMREETTREASAAWLTGKGAAAGFRIDPEELRLDGEEWVRIPRREGRNAALTFLALTFAGVLQVDDPARFLAALLSGFGAAKAYGCGLMLIRRAG